MEDQPLLQFFTWRRTFNLVWYTSRANTADSRQSHNQNNFDFWRCRDPRIDETGTAELLTQCHNYTAPLWRQVRVDKGGYQVAS